MQQLWRAVSEETTEAATDPSPPFYWLNRDNAPLDWLKKGEVADICTADHPSNPAQVAFGAVACLVSGVVAVAMIPSSE